MKRMTLIPVCFLFILLISTPLLAGELKVSILRIEGMTCFLCPIAVKKALKNVPGVKKVEVIYKEKKAVVEYEEDNVNSEDLIKVVDEIGFKAYLREEYIRKGR